MKNISKERLYLNTIILFIISILNITIISSSNSIFNDNEHYTTIKLVQKAATPVTTEEVLEPAAIIEEVPVVEEKTVVEEAKVVKQETTKKTTTTTKKTPSNNTKKTTTTTTTTKKTLQETLAEKTKKYGLEIGNISISNSSFSKDLVKDDKSYYYLDNNLDGKLDHRGVPFIDYRHDFTGRKTIIYSHSAKDGKSPFNYLQNYNGNKSFFDKHQYITVVYGGKTYKYQIFSVYISVADSEEHEGLEYYRVMNYTDEEWENKIQEYKRNSDYDTGVSVSKNDKILILQTCSMDNRYYKKYYRYNQLVMAKLISVK